MLSQAVVKLAASLLLLAQGAVFAAPPSDPQEWDYKVSLGDTLISIGRNFLKEPAAWGRLQRLNQIDDPRRLVPGSYIRIPLALLNQTVTVAEVVFCQGNAVIKRIGQGGAESAVVGAQVGAGDRVQTAADASVTLRFADGSRLMLVPSSEVAVLHLLALGKQQVPSVRLELQEGSTELRVAPTPSAKRSFEVKTQAVNLGVRGTDFRARVDASGRQAWLEVMEGRVAAQAGSGAQLVSAGQGLVAEEHQTLKPPKALLPAPQLLPANARIDRLPLRLDWQAAAGAQSYRAQVFSPDQPDNLLLDGRFTQPSGLICPMAATR
jgi:hypothetical protein